MKICDFTTPKTLDEACSSIRNAGGRAYVVAGGTSLSFMKASKDEKLAVNIMNLPLKFISREITGFRVGALSSINDLMKYKNEGWALDRVAAKMSTQQIRNVSTLGGNIARLFYWSDFPVPLLVLDGSITISGIKEKAVPAEIFFRKQPINMLSDEASIITSVAIKSLTKGMGFGYHKETRTSPAFSTLTTAACIKIHNGAVSEARVALSACVYLPQRLYDIERQLIGKKADISEVKNISLAEIDNLFMIPKEGMSDKYCRNLAKVRVNDVIAEAISEAAGRKKI